MFFSARQIISATSFSRLYQLVKTGSQMSHIERANHFLHVQPRFVSAVISIPRHANNMAPFVKYAKLSVRYTIYFRWKSKNIRLVRCMIYPTLAGAGSFSRIFRLYDHGMRELCILKSSADLSAVSMRMPDCTHYVRTSEYRSGFLLA